jgi:hypothetical protein
LNDQTFDLPAPSRLIAWPLSIAATARGRKCAQQFRPNNQPSNGVAVPRNVKAACRAFANSVDH